MEIKNTQQLLESTEATVLYARYSTTNVWHIILVSRFTRGEARCNHSWRLNKYNKLYTELKDIPLGSMVCKKCFKNENTNGYKLV